MDLARVACGRAVCACQIQAKQFNYMWNARVQATVLSACQQRMRESHIPTILVYISIHSLLELSSSFKPLLCVCLTVLTKSWKLVEACVQLSYSAPMGRLGPCGGSRSYDVLTEAGSDWIKFYCKIILLDLIWRVFAFVSYRHIAQTG